MTMTRQEAAIVARAAKAANTPPLAERFWSKVDRRGPDECWPWTAAVRNKKEGYGAFWLAGRHQPANRVALVLSGVVVPDGMEACHTCDNPGCCNPAHLFVGTRLDNNNDKVNKDRHIKGEQCWRAKLTEQQVREIRANKPEGVKRVRTGLLDQLAAKYGVTRNYISNLFRNGWRHA